MSNYFAPFVIVLAMWASMVQGAQDSYEFSDPQTRQTFLRLTETLRCPMCQNQNIADSDAMIAHDMRRKVYKLLQQGKSEQEVIDYMKSRYGDFVYYQPPVTPATASLWLIPIGFVLIGGITFLFMRRKGVGSEDTTSSRQQALAKANALLDQEK